MIGIAAPESDLAEFRRRAEQWFAANAPHDEETFSDGRAELEAARRFQQRLFDAGLAAVTWPTRFGGQGLSKAYERVLNDIAARYAPPTGVLLIGQRIVGPTILELGTDAQRASYLEPLAGGAALWCQLFSEPEAGSDVAGLRTRAVLDGGDWRISGQKVWTTHAHVADYGLLLARTDPDVAKHRGLTLFVLDLHSPGVTVRPLRDMTGASRFNEVFLDDVSVPGDRVIGAVNGGWRAAITMLSYERVAIGERTRPRSHPISYALLVEAARERGLLGDLRLRERLVELLIKERQAAVFTDYLVEKTQAGHPPGAQGSVGKLLNAELAELAVEVAQDILGPASVFWPSADERARRTAHAISEKHSWSVAGGTSEIQRTIIGEQLLGLDKEPQVDTDVPFRVTVARSVS